jgi:hypothetical protein
MKSKVIIKPYGENDQMLPGLYHYKNVVRILTSPTTYVEVKSDEKNQPPSHTLNFNKKNRQLEYEYELEDALKTPEDRSIEAVIKIFWGQHPQLNINGVTHANTKAPLYNLTNVTEVGIVDHKLWDKKLSIANRINSMSVDDKRDVSYFYGVSPIGKTSIELTLLLADFEKGLCMQAEKVNEFIDVWLPETNTEREYITNTHKAMAMGVFNNSVQDSRNNYYYGQTFVGTTFNDVLSFCKREERIYKESVLRAIAEHEANQKKADKANENKNKHGVDVSVEKAAREEARELQKAGFIEKGKPVHIMKAEALKPLIEEGRKLKDAATKAAIEAVSQTA